VARNSFVRQRAVRYYGAAVVVNYAGSAQQAQEAVGLIYS
jgi:hypothetical protein